MKKEWKPKTIILFNKNHINLTKTQLRDNVEVPYFKIESVTNGTTYNMYKRHWVPTQTFVEEKESPLGFVYTKKKTIKGHWEQENIGNENELKRPQMFSFSIRVDKYLYNMAYPVSKNQSLSSERIGVDVRPWEIIDKEAMPEHFIDDLFNIVNELVRIIKEANICKRLDDISFEDWNSEQFIQQLYIDLFGNIKGPVYQTNDEKILSHGFDLVTSFRKQKTN